VRQVKVWWAEVCGTHSSKNRDEWGSLLRWWCRKKPGPAPRALVQVREKCSYMLNGGGREKLHVEGVHHWQASPCAPFFC
jgi:hypothetical protein